MQEFTLTDDTVLEEHFEDPRLTQMKLLGEGGKQIKFFLIEKDFQIKVHNFRNFATHWIQTQITSVFEWPKSVVTLDDLIKVLNQKFD